MNYIKCGDKPLVNLDLCIGISKTNNDNRGRYYIDFQFGDEALGWGFGTSYKRDYIYDQLPCLDLMELPS